MLCLAILKKRGTMKLYRDKQTKEFLGLDEYNEEGVLIRGVRPIGAEANGPIPNSEVVDLPGITMSAFFENANNTAQAPTAGKIFVHDDAVIVAEPEPSLPSGLLGE